MHELMQMRNLACLSLAQRVGRPVFLDIGAAAGPNHTSLDFLVRQDAITFFGLEPDPHSCSELQSRYANARFLQVAVADVPCERDLFITFVRGCSSCLEPNFEVIQKWPIHTWMRVLEKSRISVTTVESLVATQVIPQPDFVKLDIQGLEYEALTGFGAVLDGVIGIELEATLQPIYKGQRLLWEIIEYLNSRGFILRDLHHQGPFEHEFVEVNAFFSRRPADRTVDMYKLKLWEFFSEVTSPGSLGQMQIRSNDRGHEFFSAVDPLHWQRLLGETVS